MRELEIRRLFGEFSRQQLTDASERERRLRGSNADLVATVSRTNATIEELQARLNHDSLIGSLIADRDAWRAKALRRRWLTFLLGVGSVVALVDFIRWAVTR